MPPCRRQSGVAYKSVTALRALTLTERIAVHSEQPSTIHWRICATDISTGAFISQFLLVHRRRWRICATHLFALPFAKIPRDRLLVHASNRPDARWLAPMRASCLFNA